MSSKSYPLARIPASIIAALLISGLVIYTLAASSTGKAQTSGSGWVDIIAGGNPAIYLPLIIDQNDLSTPQPTPIQTTVSPTSMPTLKPTPQGVRFAVIGDYGSGNNNAGNVARLIDSWQVDFIITTGDNNYPDGKMETIDTNIGQFYHSYIYPYAGYYGLGASQNRFYPSLGNHDWYTTGAQPYLNYFVLPGNERYYDFVWEPIHFFVLDSDYQEPDGRTVTSTQAKWLSDKLAASTSTWNIVYLHEPPYASGPHGEEASVQWPYKDWGADIVFSGHEHNYERLLADGLTYVINGLGGDSMDGFPNLYGSNDPVQSLVRYNSEYGAMLVDVTTTQLSYKFITRNNMTIDSFSLTR